MTLKLTKKEKALLTMLCESGLSDKEAGKKNVPTNRNGQQTSTKYLLKKPLQ